MKTTNSGNTGIIATRRFASNTRQCLLKALDLACEQDDIQATELGKSIYQSLGFEVNGTIDVFRIKKASHNIH